jgi:riboflavin synthase
MFTGIVQALGIVEGLDPLGEDYRLRIRPQALPIDDMQLGHSVAINGVCLTVRELAHHNLAADVSGETLARTTLGTLVIGSRVNLEKPLTLATPLGGHLVSGHVDGTGTVEERRDAGRSVQFRVEAPAALARYIAEKGSICVDGISLTVNSVRENTFEVNIIPHTLGATTMGDFAVGRKVNLEVDLIARYLERLLHAGRG